MCEFILCCLYNHRLWDHKQLGFEVYCVGFLKGWAGSGFVCPQWLWEKRKVKHAWLDICKVTQHPWMDLHKHHKSNDMVLREWLHLKVILICVWNHHVLMYTKLPWSDLLLLFLIIVSCDVLCAMVTELRGPEAHGATSFWLHDNSENELRPDYTSPAFLSKPVSHTHTQILHTHRQITEASQNMSHTCLFKRVTNGNLENIFWRMVILLKFIVVGKKLH